MRKDLLIPTNLASKKFYENDRFYEEYISKKEIISSGKSILNIINIQITLILVISLIVESALMFSLMRLVYENNLKSINNLKLCGFTTKELRTIHFGFNDFIAILMILLSYFVALVIARKFLDNIMFTFPNYVKISNNYNVFLLSNGLILGIYILFLLQFNLKLRRTV